jgi:hypothetical protein
MSIISTNMDYLNIENFITRGKSKLYRAVTGTKGFFGYTNLSLPVAMAGQTNLAVLL